MTAIDWDCTYCRRLLPAYYTELAEHMALQPIHTVPILEMILFKFGFRFLQRQMFAKTQETKDEAILALELISALAPQPY